MGSPLQCLLGISCNDFTMIAADLTKNLFGILVDGDEKVHKMSDNLVMGVNGDSAEAAQFTDYVARNLQLYRIRNGYPLSVASAVHFTRRNLAESLRSGNPCLLNLLMGGYDEKEGGQLYYMDILASCLKVPYAAHGLGGMFSLPILAWYHKPTLTQQEAYQVLTFCVQEVHRRLYIKLPNFQVSVISKDGVKKMPVIEVFIPTQGQTSIT